MPARWGPKEPSSYEVLIINCVLISSVLEVGSSPTKRTRAFRRALLWSNADGFSEDPTWLAHDNIEVHLDESGYTMCFGRLVTSALVINRDTSSFFSEMSGPLVHNSIPLKANPIGPSCRVNGFDILA